MISTIAPKSRATGESQERKRHILVNTVKLLIALGSLLALFKTAVARNGHCSKKRKMAGPACPKAEVIISDGHIGTSMWQSGVLEALGHSAQIDTLSTHVRYAKDVAISRSDLFSSISETPTSQVRQQFAQLPEYQAVRWALCSFPPARFEALAKLPEHVRILVNVGHRIHIHVHPRRIVEITEAFRTIANNPRFQLATMSEYDYHYVRYYTGIELMRLPVIAMHAPPHLRESTYQPANRTVLIGPSHNTSVIIGFNNDLSRLNRESKAFAKARGLRPYTFDFIKSVYPSDQATLYNLAKHPAVLMNPYSAFSISMVELYQMNIPFFVPKDELLVDQMGDVRLHPIYQPKDAINALEARRPVVSMDYPYSPNDPAPEAQRHWLQYMYFNQVVHAQRWSAADELFRLLYEQDLPALHGKMRAENTTLVRIQLAQWQRLLTQSPSHLFAQDSK